MIGGLLKKIFGTKNDREIKALTKEVEKINALESEYEKLSDEELKNKTNIFKERLQNGETLDDILVEAFATVREASKRVLGLRHYDVQLIGGMVLHQGKITEMKTGEGKTLVATCPVYLNALAGHGVHVITVNDYLAKRDRDQMSRLYGFLGLSSGVILNGLPTEQRKKSYNSDITYGTNSEFGFDYLRDNMVSSLDQKVQRELNFCIVDEVDSILIDEARTPLIISGAAEDKIKWYQISFQVVSMLNRSYETEKIKNIKEKKAMNIPDEKWGDYEVDEKSRVIVFTEKGVKRVEEILKIENLYAPEYVELTHFLHQALKAKELFKRDRDYLVRDNGEVVIIDEFTGRAMEGRRYSDGLHQAIEAKEGVKIASENQTLATITLQNYFRMYNKLSGMTGTAKTEEEEFKQIYKLGVVVVPTNRPVQRKDMPDVIYQTTRAKHKAIVKKIIELFEKGQPVLVGTASIEHSELLSSYLTKARIPHEVLNAKYHEREADIVAQAGRFKTVTIATNMAGRGTDIKLGGDPESLALKIAERGTPEFYDALHTYEKECNENKEKVLEAGGLFILGTERHESRRIDNQLRGRAGRQGDPGASEFYLSLEDDLMRLFGGDRIKSMMSVLKIDEDEELRNKRVSKAVENAQKRIESRNFSTRKSLIEYDDVNNKQREVIYKQRDQILYNQNLRELVFDMIDNTIVTIVDNFLPQTKPSDWNFEDLNSKFIEVYDIELPETINNAKNKEEIYDLLFEIVSNKYKEKVEEIGEEQFSNIERYIMLEVLDQKWRQNLKDLTELREGINLQSYGQKNPVNEYKISSTDVYNDMIDGINRETTSFLLRLKLREQEENTENASGDEESIEDKEIPMSRREKME